MKCHTNCEGCSGVIDVVNAEQAVRFGMSRDFYDTLKRFDIVPIVCGLTLLAGKEKEAQECNSNLKGIQTRAVTAKSNDEDLTNVPL